MTSRCITPRRRRSAQAKWLAVAVVGLIVLVWASSALGGQVITTFRATPATDGGEPDGTSEYPDISANGRFVTFWSEASDLVPGDTNETGDVFVFDRRTGEVSRASLTDAGEQSDEYSEYPAISGDGRIVVFESYGQLVPEDTDSYTTVYARDRLLDRTIMVSVPATESAVDGWSSIPDVSECGCYVTFASYASNLVPGDENGDYDVFIRDLVAGTTERVSVASDGSEATGMSYASAVSAGGRFVAFYSTAEDLAPDSNGVGDIFVRDRVAGTTEKVSVGTGGTQNSSASDYPSISGDGRYVVFETAGALDPADTNGVKDIYVRDLVEDTTTRVSVDAGGGDANASSYYASISSDGRFIAFNSGATDIVEGDTGGQTPSFVRDMWAGETVIASGPGGGTPADDDCYEPSVASAGTNFAVAYYSSATNLVTPAQSGSDYQIYITETTDLGPDGPSSVAGSDRYGTAVEVSKTSFPEGSDTVIIATGLNWPDALGGAALAGAYDAPILLVRPTAVPSEVSAEITRLGASRAIVLGGTVAVSDTVKSQLEGLVGVGNVDRISGATRYETSQRVASAAITKLGVNYDGTAFAATGGDFPDALAGSPVSFARGVPIYLVNPRGSAPADAMKSHGVEQVEILGGTSAVSSAAEASLRSAFGVSNVGRLAGSDRYATGVAVATYGVDETGMHWDGVAFGTGMDFPDALAGSAVPARNGSVMLLTAKDSLPGPVKTAITSHAGDVTTYYYLGGTNAVSQKVRDQIDAILD